MPQQVEGFQAAKVTFFTYLKESLGRELRNEKFDPIVTVLGDLANPTGDLLGLGLLK